MTRHAHSLTQIDTTPMARRLALACLDAQAIPVIDLQAARVLARAFDAMLRTGGTAFVTRVTIIESRALKRCTGAAGPWLVVGLDGRGRGVIALDTLWVGAANTAWLRRLAEAAMLAKLARAVR